MSKKDTLDEVVGVVLGVLGGIALATLLKTLLQRKCPRCNNLNESNRKYCKFCGGRLR